MALLGLGLGGPSHLRFALVCLGGPRMGDLSGDVRGWLGMVLLATSHQS